MRNRLSIILFVSAILFSTSAMADGYRSGYKSHHNDHHDYQRHGYERYERSVSYVGGDAFFGAFMGGIAAGVLRDIYRPHRGYRVVEHRVIERHPRRHRHGYRDHDRHQRHGEHGRRHHRHDRYCNH